MHDSQYQQDMRPDNTIFTIFGAKAFSVHVCPLVNAVQTGGTGCRPKKTLIKIFDLKISTKGLKSVLSRFLTLNLNGAYRNRFFLLNHTNGH